MLQIVQIYHQIAWKSAEIEHFCRNLYEKCHIFKHNDNQFDQWSPWFRQAGVAEILTWSRLLQYVWGDSSSLSASFILGINKKHRIPPSLWQK